MQVCKLQAALYTSVFTCSVQLILLYPNVTVSWCPDWFGLQAVFVDMRLTRDTLTWQKTPILQTIGKKYYCEFSILLEGENLWWFHTGGFFILLLFF